MSERIPQDVLDAAHLRLCREVAAVIAMAMAETGAQWATLDAKCSKKPGYFKAFFVSLMDGDTKELREVSDMCCALGTHPIISLQKLPEPRAQAPNPPEKERT